MPEARVLLVRLRLLVRRAVSRVGHAERRDDHRDLREAALVGAGQQDAPEPRVDRQRGEPLAQRRDVVVLGERAQFLQRALAVAHEARVGWLDEREPGDVAEPQRVHLQDHGREVGALDLRLGVLGPRVEVLLRIEADGDAGADASAAAGALVGRGARDLLDRQPLQAAAVAVAADARVARVDDGADARHRERGLGDVGREHDSPPARRAEHALLLGLREARVQRQDLAVLGMVATERLGGLADLAFAAQEHEDVAVLLAPQLADRVGDRGLLGILGLVLLVLLDLHGAVAHLDREAAARDVDDRGVAEVAREALGVDGRRGDDEPEVGPARQQPREVAEQEVDVQAALVRLVDDQRVVLVQVAVVLGLGEQDAVGHQLDEALAARAVLEAHLVAHHLPEG